MQKICKKVHKMNLGSKKKKLQTAIIKSGLVIKINTDQFYSADQKRMITAYRIITPTLSYSKKYKEYRLMDYEILKTYSMVDLVLCLRDIYWQIQEWGIVRDLRSDDEIDIEQCTVGQE